MIIWLCCTKRFLYLRCIENNFMRCRSNKLCLILWSFSFQVSSLLNAAK